MLSLLELRKKRVELIASLETSEKRSSELRALIAETDALIRAIETQAARSEDVETALFRQLTMLRHQLASGGDSPYSIFDDDTLLDIVRERPTTELALLKIRGISPRRLKKFGDKVVACVIRCTDPDRPPPPRPFFEKCSFCNELQVLANEPPEHFRCRKCLKSTDPRTKRPHLSVKLPKGTDFD